MNAERRPGQGAHPDYTTAADRTPPVRRGRSPFERNCDAYWRHYEAKFHAKTLEERVAELERRLGTAS